MNGLKQNKKKNLTTIEFLYNWLVEYYLVIDVAKQTPLSSKKTNHSKSFYILYIYNKLLSPIPVFDDPQLPNNELPDNHILNMCRIIGSALNSSSIIKDRSFSPDGILVEIL
jgi:hypothetical protein